MNKFTVIWRHSGDGEKNRLDHVKVPHPADTHSIMDAALKSAFKEIEGHEGMNLEDFLNNMGFDGCVILPGWFVELPDTTIH